MPKNPAKYFAAETRATLIREAFDAFATVGFLKWKREEIERHGTSPELIERERASYVKELKKSSWPWFRDTAEKATDGRLLDVREDWIERAEGLALLDRQGKLTMQQVHDELRRYTGGSYPKAEEQHKQKGRDFEPER